MKLLYREDVEEAGYDLPKEGLCANIGEQEMNALKFGGEWVLARDEVLVSDGHEQRFLYMVVNGQVGIYKADDQGRNQQIASLGVGAAFGEMAFLSGGVASATVQAVGECILWRMDHERLLEFIGENGFAGGQLCLNVASILSGRLVEGNRKVLDMGRDLQESLAHLQSASAADQQKSEALKQMQSKVSNMQNAFKGSAVKKSGLSPLSIVAFALAGLSTLGMIGLFVSIDDSVAERADTLAKKVEKMEKNEAFYLQLKKQLEGENAEMVDESNALKKANEDLEKEVADSAEKVDDLKDEVRDLEKELSRAKDDIVRAQRAVPAQVSKPESTEPKVSKTFVQEVIAWAHKNSTLAFPSEITITETAITLTDRSQQVQVPVRPGGELRAMRFHPSAQDYLIVAQLKSDKLLATVKIDNSNLIEVLAPVYVRHMNSMGNSIKNPFEKKKVTKPDSALGNNASRSSPVSTQPEPSKEESRSSVSPSSSTPRKVIQSKALMPQKGEDFLKSTAPSSLKSMENDHGNSCVCKECRAKKVGKGSLFPD
jgi:CRP-like cAMP-binding protein